MPLLIKENRSKREKYPLLDQIPYERITLWYEKSDIQRKLKNQRGLRHLREGLAFITDLDHTLNVKGLEPVSHRLASVLQEFDIPIIAVTGVTPAEVKRRISTGESPAVDVIVGSGGLAIEVARKQNGQTVFTPDDIFRQKIETSDVWNRSEVVRMLSIFMQALNSVSPNFELQFQQPDEYKPDYSSPEPLKVGLYFMAQSLELRQEMDLMITNMFPQLIHVICSEINHNAHVGREEKYCLDLTTMDKLGAILYLQQILGLTGGITAGDSGNDERHISLLPGFPGVAVGGSKTELLELIKQHAVRPKATGFHEMMMPNAKPGQIYTEASADRVGPQSLVYALRILARYRQGRTNYQAENNYFSDLYRALTTI